VRDDRGGVLVIAAVMKMLAWLVSLIVRKGNIIAGMAMADGAAQPWCFRGIQKQPVASSRGPENTTPAPSQFSPRPRKPTASWIN
jgi:hypothetical protein